MTRLIPTPMPVVLSTGDAVAERFGIGSELHRIAERLNPSPPKPRAPEWYAARARHEAEHAARRHAMDIWNIGTAFAAVGECIALVEAHAVTLHDADLTSTDACPRGDLREWRAMAFRSLAFLYERSPELLPIGPAVHADCHGDDQ